VDCVFGGIVQAARKTATFSGVACSAAPAEIMGKECGNQCNPKADMLSP
jgi:hypothetical protein